MARKKVEVTEQATLLPEAEGGDVPEAEGGDVPETEGGDIPETAVKAASPPLLKEGSVYQYNGKNYVVTKAGLPNSCAVTGKPIKAGLWMAESIDHARAGNGIEHTFFFETATKSESEEA